MYVITSYSTSSIIPKKQVSYYEGEFGGEYVYTDVLHAKRFETLADALDYIKARPTLFSLGFGVIDIAKVTFEKLKESYDTDRTLYNKYHTAEILR